MNLFPVLSLISLSFLFGCGGEEPVRLDEPKRLSLDWSRSDWRICAEDECAKPTPKTVLLVAPPPVVAPVAMEPPKPIQAARKLNPISVLFQFARTKVSVAAEMAIKNAIAMLEPGDSILVEGRTDDIGSQSSNDRLANKRSEGVAMYLKRIGVKNPIEIRSKGKCCYAMANDSDASRAINRRVELHFSTTQKE